MGRHGLGKRIVEEIMMANDDGNDSRGKARVDT